MERLLSRAKQVAEEAEVFRVSSQEVPVRFEANHLKQIQTKESASVGLRLIKQGRIGFAAASGLSHPETLVDMALETSQFGMPAKFVFPSVTAYPQVEVFDSEVDKITIEEMIELGEHLIAEVRGHTPDIVCEAEVVKAVASVHILNSRGGEVSYRKSLFGLSLEGVVIRDTDMLFVGDSESSCRPVIDFKVVAQRVMRQLELAKNKAAVPTKLMPVVFTPRGVASTLIAPLALAFNGKIVFEGVSPLAKKQGEKVFDKRLSLRDDATLPYRIGSRPCDGEGVPSQCTPLIESGVVSSFLYDLQTAALANTQSTGSGNRTGGGLPSPSPSSLLIGEGDVSFDDMVADIKEGLVVELLIGAEQGNLLSGDFSGNALLAYKVENGEIVGRVKDTMVSGNVYQVLKQLEAVGREARWVGGFLRTPHLYCPSLSVAAKTG